MKGAVIKKKKIKFIGKSHSRKSHSLYSIYEKNIILHELRLAKERTLEELLFDKVTITKSSVIFEMPEYEISVNIDRKGNITINDGESSELTSAESEEPNVAAAGEQEATAANVAAAERAESGEQGEDEEPSGLPPGYGFGKISDVNSDE